MSNTQNVTAAKPKVEGAIYSAPLGTALPTDATTKLNVAFKSLGYVSEDGLKNTNSPSSESVKAWGGDTVNTVQKDKEDTFSYKLIEALNVDVLKEIYGAENVSGDLSTGISVKSNAKELSEHSLVIEMILKGGILKRIVIPEAKIIEIGEVTYSDGEIVGFELKVQAFPNAQGDTHYEYIKKSSTGGTA